MKGEDDGSALRRDEEQLDDRDSQPFRTIAFYSGKDGLIAQVRFLGGRK